jgi:ABC-2 type transport system permease protein
MNIDRIRTIIDKEWAEVFKNRSVIYTMFFMPTLLTLLPLGILILLRATAGGGDTTDMPAGFAASCQGLPSFDCLQIYITNQFLLLFMLMPTSIPVAIAAYSIVGEKTTHSLEPLLATPVTTSELLLAKGLAAVLPAILVTWLCFAIFAVALLPIGVSEAVLARVVSPVWLSAILLDGPLMAVLAVISAIIVSSRVSDPRAAEQISMVVIVPILGVMFGQLGGLFVINTQFVWIAALLLLALDVLMVYAATRLFQRETILTQWR